MKRAIDIVLALVMLLFAVPLLIFALAATWLETPGSPVFVQTRVGRGGRRFKLYKVRTMVVRNDESVHRQYVAALIEGRGDRQDGLYKLVGDPRVTRVGRLLRRYSVDELPQLWNVLKGDMSVVGPRPPLPYEVALYGPRDWQRLNVKPGLTGLWQVSGRACLSYRDMVEIDIQYCESWSVWLDLGILLRTPLAVFTAAGAA